MKASGGRRIALRLAVQNAKAAARAARSGGGRRIAIRLADANARVAARSGGGRRLSEAIAQKVRQAVSPGLVGAAGPADRSAAARKGWDRRRGGGIEF